MMPIGRMLQIVVVVAIAGCSAVPTPEPPTPPPPAAEPVPSVAGAWVLTVKSPVSIADTEAVFVQSGRQLSGRMMEAHGEVPFSGSIDGDVVRFGMSVEVQGKELRIDYAGAVEGDTMHGTVRFGSFGAGTWSGRKKLEH